MAKKIYCVACGRLVPANPRAKNQKYCGAAPCQRARKAAWQREKKDKDEKYRQDQKDAQKDWRDNNPDYWRKYRENHPEYTERNRLLQKVRDSRPKAAHLAKMDALAQKAHFIPGTYYLVPYLAKMDVFRHKVHIITAS
jgi:hypothetical protein